MTMGKIKVISRNTALGVWGQLHKGGLSKISKGNISGQLANAATAQNCYHHEGEVRGNSCRLVRLKIEGDGKR